MNADTLQLKLLYRDRSIVIINKPCGLLSVPGRGEDKHDCVAERLKKTFPDMIAQPAVHRLDMYTSGLMVFARTVEAHRLLSMQFEKRQVRKHYQALLDGVIETERGEIQLSFRLDPTNRPLQIYDAEHGKPGITIWKNLGTQDQNSRIEFIPLTGRTHQLRIHSAHPLGLGTPIVGDSLYGTGKDGDQMMLHATSLEFSHPESMESVCFKSTPPF